MNKRTKTKLANCVTKFVKDLILVADEENYDRDSFVKAAAEMCVLMSEISTFKHWDTKQGGEGDG